MADALSRLAGPAQAANGTSTWFTGTAAHTYTIRNITLINQGASAVTAKVGIGGVTDALLIMPPISIDASGGQVVIDSVFVISGTETIQGNVSAASSITYSIHGIDQV